jgi:hypothetical protein
MPIAMLTLAEPKTFPTTVGMSAKNPPLAAPLTITKTTSGARLLDTGHRASMLNAESRREMKSVFNGPSTSLRTPKPILPMADEKLKPAKTRQSSLIKQ